ncbi:hypothetical protein TIFTF001_043759 [Ficus carica]|uniref:Uncharacterized protein n=1 Tax=Ficus carica TaxID=3494 RepID=A0AA87YSN1_FICCA|nr:hypothetical protein TIFTF001_051161 [Ficus carica]GMN24173.1 hypothetical protein TIFTF001_043759 [Ficus carica]
MERKRQSSLKRRSLLFSMASSLCAKRLFIFSTSFARFDASSPSEHRIWVLLRSQRNVGERNLGVVRFGGCRRVGSFG